MSKLEQIADDLVNSGNVYLGIEKYACARSEILSSRSISLIDYSRINEKITNALKMLLNDTQ